MKTSRYQKPEVEKQRLKISLYRGKRQAAGQELLALCTSACNCTNCSGECIVITCSR